ncbi:hypothetical protein C8N24_2842 [Solirubrobacter pauli]|uniref:Uncharacterized protein n=1 Tax=Solirubrobacter pauli TaxID=166793 RepID=A0A660LFM2_9ACTN|nr:hypothetical protein [Solirubrobacter pauli]RKQ92985.1 hypothetical protein C8N24_2842 [Solirubrobacter pauli]
MSGEERPSWSLQAGVDPREWPEAAREATKPLRQGSLVERPPLVYAADAAHPIHATTRAWAGSSRASSGVVSVQAEKLRPAYGLVVTQTCDLVEEGTPKRPWVHIAPVYALDGDKGTVKQIKRGRGFTYLCHVTGLEAPDAGIWVADLRLLVPVEKGWLVGRPAQAGFADEDGYDRLRVQLAATVARKAFATVINHHVLGPTVDLLRELAGEYEGNDPIVDVGLLLGRSRLDPQYAQVVFMLDSELSPDLRTRILDWWETTAEVARAAGLETLVPRFVSLDELSAREYRALDLLDAQSFSPDD